MKFLLFLIISTTAFTNHKPMIFNGKDAVITDDVAKYTVAIQMPNEEDDGVIQYYKGTAFVIGENLLMTAAHNLFYLKNKMTIEAILDLQPQYGLSDGTQQRIAIEDYRIHPNFRTDKFGTYNDIAIIKLKNKLPSRYVPLELNWIADAHLLKRQNLLVAGFGVTTDFRLPDPNPKKLRFTEVPFIEGNKSTIASSDKLIADQSKTGFCSGDSGGPLLIQMAGKTYPIGVIVHTFQDQNGNWSCATKGAFTRISYFKDWAEKSIKELN